VILAGASGIIRVGFAFFGSYAMRFNCSANRVPAELLDCNVRDEYAKFGDLNERKMIEPASRKDNCRQSLPA